MITPTKAFQTSDGQTWPTLALAQRAEMLKLVTKSEATETELRNANLILDEIFTRLDDVRAILRCTGRKPRGKAKGNGAARKRKGKAEVTV